MLAVKEKSQTNKGKSRKGKSNRNKSNRNKYSLYLILIPLALFVISISFPFFKALKSKPSTKIESLDPSAASARERMEESKYKTEVGKNAKARATVLAGPDPSRYLLKGLAIAGRARGLSLQADSPEQWAEVEKL